MKGDREAIEKDRSLEHMAIWEIQCVLIGPSLAFFVSFNNDFITTSKVPNPGLYLWEIQFQKNFHLHLPDISPPLGAALLHISGGSITLRTLCLSSSLFPLASSGSGPLVSSWKGRQNGHCEWVVLSAWLPLPLTHCWPSTLRKSSTPAWHYHPSPAMLNIG